jgi:hypothetical protein
MKKLLLVAVALAFALPAFANPIPVVDWECHYTVLGLYGDGDPSGSRTTRRPARRRRTSPGCEDSRPATA